MDTLDKILRQELEFEMDENYSYVEEDVASIFKLILMILALKEDVASILRKDEFKNLFKRMSPEIYKKIKLQLEILYDGVFEEASDVTEKGRDGTELKETIKDRRRKMKQDMMREALLIESMFKEGDLSIGKNANKFIKERIEKIVDSYKRFEKTTLVYVRERHYDRIDQQSILKGWLSIAVLDSGTTPLCSALNNRFYSSKNYSSRLTVPYPIPRHYACRSKLIGIEENESISKYKNEDFTRFLRRNKDVGEKYMGREKYKLFMENNLRVKDIVDFKREAFKTNKQLTKQYS